MGKTTTWSMQIWTNQPSAVVKKSPLKTSQINLQLFYQFQELDENLWKTKKPNTQKSDLKIKSSKGSAIDN